MKEAAKLAEAADGLINSRADGRTDTAAKVLEGSFGDAAGQQAINVVEAAHRSVFVSGWRPAVGWVLVVALALTLVIFPILELVGIETPEIDTEVIMALLGGMLGLGAARTAERLLGKASGAIMSPRSIRKAEKLAKKLAKRAEKERDDGQEN